VRGSLHGWRDYVIAALRTATALLIRAAAASQNSEKLVGDKPAPGTPAVERSETCWRCGAGV